MKFQRETLIERAKARRAALIQYADRAAREAERKREERISTTMGSRDLRPLINLLRRAQDNNAPLTKKDFTDLGINGVGSDGWDSRVTLTSPIILDLRVTTSEKADTRRVDQFIAFLEAATDDEVSSTALFQHGFKDFANLT